MDADVLQLYRIALVVLAAVGAVVVPIIARKVNQWLQANIDADSLAVLTEIIAQAVAAAEGQFESGAEKKAFVKRLAKKAAAELKINLPEELLDMLLDMWIESQVYIAFNQHKAASMKAE